MIQQTLDVLIKRYGFQLEDITIEDVRIGVFLTAVKLSNGGYGLASTQIKRGRPEYRRQTNDVIPFTPLHIKGQKISRLFFDARPMRLGDSLQVAVLNALSSLVMTSKNYHILEDKDPVDLLDLSEGKMITLVGAFQSYIRKLKTTAVKLQVLELKPDAFQSEDRQYYVPASEAERVLPHSNAIIITGSATVNHSLDALLDLIPASATVAITGPSSSYIPDVLFEKGIDFIGATRITYPEKMMQMVGEGGSGRHLFRSCAQKIVVARKKPSLTILAGSAKVGE